MSLIIVVGLAGLLPRITDCVMKTNVLSTLVVFLGSVMSRPLPWCPLWIIINATPGVLLASVCTNCFCDTFILLNSHDGSASP